MQLFTWLSKWITSETQTRRASARKSTSSFRPQLETLEGRDVPSTVTVTSAADSGAGSLRAEIAAAKNNDTIDFAPNLKGQTITLTSGQLEISKSVSIQGLGAGQLTVSGDLQSRVFQVDQKDTVTLSGMTISNGYAGYLGNLYSYDGGGILNLGTLTVSGCILSGNSAGNSPFYSYGEHGKGGGIYNAGTLTVSNSTLSGNQAGSAGGGLYNADMATISGCTLSSPSSSLTNLNTRQAAYDGGGIYNAGTLTVNYCTFSYNFATLYGGAIYNQGILTVRNSVFSNNIAGHFANNIYGLYNDGGGNTFA